MAYSGSAAARLAAVQASIDQILSGAQEYSIRGRAARRAELRDLRTMEKELQTEVGLATQGQVASVGLQVPQS